MEDSSEILDAIEDLHSEVEDIKKDLEEIKLVLSDILDWMVEEEED